MGNLRDQLNKAKLISKKDQKRLAHEERVHKTKVGREGLERELEQRRRELEEQKRSEREESRRQQAAVEEERRAAAEVAACEDIIARKARQPRVGGGRPWHFELPDGRLPHIVLGDGDRLNLTAGHACVVRVGAAPSHTYALLDMELGRRVAKSLADRVVWPQMDGAPAAP